MAMVLNMVAVAAIGGERFALQPAVKTTQHQPDFRCHLSGNPNEKVAVDQRVNSVCGTKKNRTLGVRRRTLIRVVLDT